MLDQAMGDHRNEVCHALSILIPTSFRMSPVESALSYISIELAHRFCVAIASYLARERSRILYSCWPVCPIQLRKSRLLTVERMSVLADFECEITFETKGGEDERE